LGEVVEGLPVHLAWLGQAQRHWPFSRLPLPHIPAQGERVRSWYVCDIFATSPRLARDLVRHVAQRARSRGINFCNVVAGADDPLLSALRADHLAMFSPLMRYKLMARRSSGGPLPQLTKIRVDALDI